MTQKDMEIDREEEDELGAGVLPRAVNYDTVGVRSKRNWMHDMDN